MELNITLANVFNVSSNNPALILIPSWAKIIAMQSSRFFFGMAVYQLEL